MDHVGGLSELMKRVSKRGLELVVHPAAFRQPRYLKAGDDMKIKLPSFTREKVEEAGMQRVETEGPYPLLDGDVLFLGGIPRLTDFEKVPPSMIYKENEEEKWDKIPEDSSIITHVKGKGLVVLSGCAHSGIINTVNYAKEISGIQDVIRSVEALLRVLGPATAEMRGPWKIRDTNGNTIGEWTFKSDQK